MAADKKYTKKSTPQTRAFGRLLAEAREAKHLTQEKVAELLTQIAKRSPDDPDISRGYVGNLEVGKVHRPGPEIFEALEAVLDVPRAQMLQKLGLLPEDDQEQEYLLMQIHRIGDLPPNEQREALQALPERTQEALKKISLGYFGQAILKASE